MSGPPIPGLKLVQQHGYATFEAESSEAFLNCLSPVIGFGAHSGRRLVYRGQKDAEWDLVPKSRRKQSWPLPMSHGDDTLHHRLIAEAATLLAFCELANRQGLLVPHYGEIRGQLLGKIFKFAEGDFRALPDWPPRQAVPALALAQHNGLPTCLLDFTWNPHVAAYFAAIELLGCEPVEGSLCVWVIDDSVLTLVHSNKQVELLVPPASDNRTLQAQEGVFLFAPMSVPEPDLLGEEFTPSSPLEEYYIAENPNGLKKVTLKCRHAKALLGDLIRLGYESARLFPTYEGAAKSVRDYSWTGLAAI